MNAIGAYIIARDQGAGWKPASGYPDNDPMEGAAEPRPGVGARVRKLFGPRPRVAREPGFAAASDWLDDVHAEARRVPVPERPSADRAGAPPERPPSVIPARRALERGEIGRTVDVEQGPSARVEDPPLHGRHDRRRQPFQAHRAAVDRPRRAPPRRLAGAAFRRTTHGSTDARVASLDLQPRTIHRRIVRDRGDEQPQHRRLERRHVPTHHEHDLARRPSRALPRGPSVAQPSGSGSWTSTTLSGSPWGRSSARRDRPRRAHRRPQPPRRPHEPAPTARRPGEPPACPPRTAGTDRRRGRSRRSSLRPWADDVAVRRPSQDAPSIELLDDRHHVLAARAGRVAQAGRQQRPPARQAGAPWPRAGRRPAPRRPGPASRRTIRPAASRARIPSGGQPAR